MMKNHFREGKVSALPVIGKKKTAGDRTPLQQTAMLYGHKNIKGISLAVASKNRYRGRQTSQKSQKVTLEDKYR